MLNCPHCRGPLVLSVEKAPFCPRCLDKAQLIASLRWPQYREPLQAMVYGRALRSVTTKFGLAVAKGESVLVRWTVGARFQTIWSRRNEVLTSVPASAVKLLPFPGEASR